MNITRNSQAHWQGNVTTGQGQIQFGSGAFSGDYSFNDRIGEDSKSTNPEELIAAAHAGCFSMAFSAELTKANYQDIDIKTIAYVTLSKTAEGLVISNIALQTSAKVRDINQAELEKIALHAKINCPVAKALAAVKITLKLNDVDLA